MSLSYRKAGLAAGACVGVLSGAVALFVFWCFPRPLTQNVIGMYDHWMVAIPYAYFFDYSIHHDKTFPLWYPLMMCGRPFAAYAGIGLFYPLYALRSVLTFEPTALNACYGMAILAAIHALLAGTGAFALARRQGMSFVAALTAGLAYMLSAAFVRRSLAHWTFAATAAWLPWALIAVEVTLSATTLRQKARRALLGGLLFCLPTLAGNTQLLYYSGIAIVLYAILFRLTQGCPGGVSLKSMLFSDAWSIFLFFLVPVMVSMVMFLPAAEFAGLSARVKGAFAWQGDAASSRTPQDLWEGFVLYGARWYPERMRWCGAGALLLALAGLRSPQRRVVVCYGVLFLALLDIGIGRPMPLATLTDVLSPFDFSNAVRICILACLPLALLAGLGVDAVGASSRHRGAWTGALGFAVAGVSATLAYRVLGQRMLFHISPVAVGAPVAVGVLVLVSVWHKRLGEIPRWVMPVLVLLEILAWDREFVPYLYRMTDVTPPTLAELAGSNELWQGNTRDNGVDPLAVNRPLLNLQPAIGGYDPLYLRDVYNVLCGPGQENMYSRFVTAAAPDGAVNARYNLLLKRAFWLAPNYALGELPDKETLFPPTLVVFLEAPPALDARPGLLTDVPERSLSADVSAMPVSVDTVAGSAAGAFTFSVSEFAVPEQNAALRISYCAESIADASVLFADPGTGRRDLGGNVRFHLSPDEARDMEIPLPALAMVQTRIAGEVSHWASDLTPPTVTAASVETDLADETGLLHIQQRTANEVILSCDALPGPRLLLFVDADYRGWRAYVDKKEVSVLRADEVFKAVALSAGPHEVRFVFRPSLFYWGLAISMVSLGAVLLMLVWLGRTGHVTS